jgi:hypothetical protein
MHGTLKKTHTKRVRSGVTSGKRLFAQRVNTVSTPEGMRFRDLLTSYADALGGNDRIDEPIRNHIRRIAFIQCVLELREQEFVLSGAVTMEQTLEYQRLSNSQSRLMKRIGLFNASKKPSADDDDGELSPLEYMRRKAKSKPKRERLDDDEDDD